jgi:hypothetical protein
MEHLRNADVFRKSPGHSVFEIKCRDNLNQDREFQLSAAEAIFRGRVGYVMSINL